MLTLSFTLLSISMHVCVCWWVHIFWILLDAFFPIVFNPVHVLQYLINSSFVSLFMTVWGHTCGPSLDRISWTKNSVRSPCTIATDGCATLMPIAAAHCTYVVQNSTAIGWSRLLTTSSHCSRLTWTSKTHHSNLRPCMRQAFYWREWWSEKYRLFNKQQGSLQLLRNWDYM